MEPVKKEVTIEELIEKHAETKSSGKAAVKALKKAFGVKELTPDLILHVDLCNLCNAKGIGRKTVLLVAEVACDLSKMK